MVWWEAGAGAREGPALALALVLALALALAVGRLELAWDEAAPADWRDESKGLEVVGVTGLVGLDVDGSELPSLVLFFFRNPRLGMG